MNWRVLSILVLVGAAAFALIQWRQHPEQIPGLGSAPQQPLKPGYFMNDAHIVQTGADGRPLYRVDAERIQQNPKDLTVRLENLRLDYFPREETSTRAPSTQPSSNLPSHWLLTAKTGVMPQDARRIELQEGVVITGRAATNEGGSNERGPGNVATIRTSKLSVDIDAQTARTRQRVNITWGARQLSAVGMTADLKAERVKLESSIHGEFIR